MTRHKRQQWKKLLRLALPITTTGLLDKIANLIAVIFLAKLGQDSIAANSLAFSTFIAVFTLFITIFYAISILISHAIGEKKAEAVGLIFRSGMLLAISLAIPAAIILWHAGTLLRLFGQDPTLIALTIPYFHAIALAIIPIHLSMVIVQFYLGIKKPKIVLIRSLLCFPLLLLGFYLFINGNLGFPAYGLAGIAITTLLVRCCDLCFLLIFLYYDSSIKHFCLLSTQQIKKIVDFTLCKKLLKIGAPIGVQFGGELSAMAVITYMLGHFGVTALAAGQITSIYTVLIVMVILGVSQATSILISEAYAKKDYPLINAYKQASLRVISYLFAMFMILFCFYSKHLAGLFVDIHLARNQPLLQLTHIFFMIAGILLYIDGVRNILSACLRGLQLSIYPMVIGLLTLWFISLPVAYLAAYPLHGQAIGLRIGFISGFLIAAGVLNKLFKQKLAHISSSVQQA